MSRRLTSRGRAMRILTRRSLLPTWRRPPFLLLGAALGLWLATAGTALPAAGDLDASFGAGGRAVVDLGAEEAATALALAPDGRIVVGGYRRNPAGTPGSDGIVARLTPQGAIDKTYAPDNGWSRLDYSPTDVVKDVAVQPDGRILAAGSTYAGNGFVARLANPGGAFDPTFVDAGGTFSELPTVANIGYNSVALQPDGRILAVGTVPSAPPAAETDIAAVRLTAAGAFDKSGTEDKGWSRISIPPQPGRRSFDVGSGIALAPDGKIVVTGATSAPFTDGFAVARLLNPQGTLDFSFGLNGIASVPGRDAARGPAVAVQPDGAIVLAGPGTIGGVNAGLVTRLGSTGSPDPGFQPLAVPGGLTSAALLPNGKIVVAGFTRTPGGTDDVLVMRLQPNGLPDTTFSGDGRATVDLGGTEGATGLALQPDGRIVVGVITDANTDLVVLRLQGDALPGSGAGGPGAGAGVSGAAARCAGRAATVIGSNGRDRLRGTAKADVIVGLGGNDVIEARGGDDLVCGGGGADALRGGAGADRLLGEGGADVLRGGAGRDRLAGGAGADRLTGGAGVNVLTGGAGRNVRVQ